MENRRSSAPSQGGADNLEVARQGALDNLTSAFASSAISLEEYEARASSVQKAVSLADIDGLLIDLPQPAPRSGSVPASTYRPAAPSMKYSPDELMVEQRQGSPEFSLCVMGDRRLTGDWLNSDQATSFTLMGSTTFDLRDTALPPGRLKIDAVAIMGEIKIIVPKGVPVKMSAFPFMGEAHLAQDVARRVVDRNQPWVDVSGIALMGSIVVRSA